MSRAGYHEMHCGVYVFTARQRSCEKVMFSHVSVILSTGGVSQHALGQGVCGKREVVVKGWYSEGGVW